MADKGTQIVVGENNKTPLVLGLTGADNVINLGAEVPILFQPHEMEVTRIGSSEITVHSGNLLAVTGGSVALNVNVRT